MRRVYDSYDDTPDFYIDIDVSLVMDRRSTLDKKVAVLPLLCAASLLLATFWTHPADTARLKLNSAVCTILVVTLLALRSVSPHHLMSKYLRLSQVHAAVCGRRPAPGDHLQHGAGGARRAAAHPRPQPL